MDTNTEFKRVVSPIVNHEGKPFVTIVALQPAAADVASACASEDLSAGKWLKAAKSLYPCGLRYAMIAGKDQHKETRAELLAFIVSVLPTKKRDLLLVKGRDVVELTDAAKLQRKVYQQQCGTYVSRIATYLARHEGVTVARKAKTDKAANSDVFIAPENRDQMLVALTAISAKANTIGLPAKAASQLADAVMVALAILRSHKPKADDAAK